MTPEQLLEAQRAQDERLEAQPKTEGPYREPSDIFAVRHFLREAERLGLPLNAAGKRAREVLSVGPTTPSMTKAVRELRLTSKRISGSKTRLKNQAKRSRLGSSDADMGGSGLVWDLASGKPAKMPKRPKVEDRLRAALKALDTADQTTGLELSHALGIAELIGMPVGHPLVERCRDALTDWEASQ